jgi:ABC-type antimicrobial peptide transport system permease subunit
MALVLTATGLYGLLAYGVQQRTREIGVRMALGAMRPTIVAVVTREALAFVTGGLSAGWACWRRPVRCALSWRPSARLRR